MSNDHAVGQGKPWTECLLFTLVRTRMGSVVFITAEQNLKKTILIKSCFIFVYFARLCSTWD